MRQHLSIAVAVVALGLAGAGPAWSAEGLAASLSLARERVEAGSPAEVQFTLKNTSGTTMRVLKWHTPLEGIFGDIFAVTQDGADVPYTGLVARRADPTEEDYITLAPGEEATASVDVGANYDLTVSGAYSIALDTELMDAGPETGARLLDEMARGGELKTEAVSLEITGGAAERAAPAAPDPDMQAFRDAPDAAARTPVFTDCSETRQTQTTAAQSSALDISRTAATYLQDCGATDPTGDYDEWFGAQTPARLSTVRSNFNAIRNTLADRTIEYICNDDRCMSSWYAFVFPNDPYKVYLCPVFWSVPTSGVNSKADTIVHEVSHFTVVADTDDVVYGQTACRNLANSSPSQAITNADSYAYFADDEPRCPAGGLEHLLAAVALIALLTIWFRLRRRTAES